MEYNDYEKQFELIIKFLHENPTRLSCRSKKANTCSDEGIAFLKKKFITAKTKKLTLSQPKTTPDIAVSEILKTTQGYSNEEAANIAKEHQLSMAAENLVGALLELYIASILEKHGWVWCAGDFVKAIDFIKYNEKERIWETVQVKNRDNTENSSSSAIRNGSDIKKWFRSYSKPSKNGNPTNWENFPEKEFRNLLSEEGFQHFIKTYLSDQSFS